MMKINKTLLSLSLIIVTVTTTTNIDALNLMPPNFGAGGAGRCGPGATRINFGPVKRQSTEQERRDNELMKEWSKADRGLAALPKRKVKNKKKAQPGGVVLLHCNDAPIQALVDENSATNVALSEEITPKSRKVRFQEELEENPSNLSRNYIDDTLPINIEQRKHLQDSLDPSKSRITVEAASSHKYNTDAESEDNKLATKWRNQDRKLEDLEKLPSKKKKKLHKVEVQSEKLAKEVQVDNIDSDNLNELTPQELMSATLAKGLEKATDATARRFRRRLIKGQSPKRSTQVHDHVRKSKLPIEFNLMTLNMQYYLGKGPGGTPPKPGGAKTAHVAPLKELRRRIKEDWDRPAVIAIQEHYAGKTRGEFNDFFKSITSSLELELDLGRESDGKNQLSLEISKEDWLGNYFGEDYSFVEDSAREWQTDPRYVNLSNGVLYDKRVFRMIDRLTVRLDQEGDYGRSAVCVHLVSVDDEPETSVTIPKELTIANRGFVTCSTHLEGGRFQDAVSLLDKVSKDTEAELKNESSKAVNVRVQQVNLWQKRILEKFGPDVPVVIAGDFNAMHKDQFGSEYNKENVLHYWRNNIYQELREKWQEPKKNRWVKNPMFDHYKLKYGEQTIRKTRHLIRNTVKRADLTKFTTEYETGVHDALQQQGFKSTWKFDENNLETKSSHFTGVVDWIYYKSPSHRLELADNLPASIPNGATVFKTLNGNRTAIIDAMNGNNGFTDHNAVISRFRLEVAA